MIGAGRQREKRAPIPLKPSIQRLLKALERELGCINRDIDDTARRAPVWRQTEPLLTAVPGVGNTIARTLIAGLPELGKLSRRKIAAFAGLAPWTRQSGKWKGESSIAGGRTSVRAALFRAARVRPRRHSQKTPHHPQRHHQRPKPMARRLTPKTVAPSQSDDRAGPSRGHLLSRSDH